MTVALPYALAHRMIDVVSVEPVIGRDHHADPLYGAAVQMNCRVERATGRTVDQQGREVLYTVSVYSFDARLGDPDCRVTLDDGTRPVVVQIERAKDADGMACILLRGR